MTPMPGASGATKDEFLGWSDGGEYARAAEAAGVDVIGMLEAGVDAQQLLEFVSNYRKEEGEDYYTAEVDCNSSTSSKGFNCEDYSINSKDY